MKSIYHYRDYRQALADFYHMRKQDSSAYSYASFSLKAGLASPNYLKLVMDGKRDLTVANIHTFAKALDLRGSDVEYFEALVLENQSDSTLERKYYSRRLHSIKRLSSMNTVRSKPDALLDNSLTPAVLLCASGRNIERAVSLSSKELKITDLQSLEIIKDLIASGRLKLNEDQVLRSVTRHEIMSDPKGISVRQQKFLRDGLEEACKTFDGRYSNGKAKFLSILMTAPEKSLEDIFIQLRSAVEKASEDFDPAVDDVPGVYRVQLQVYRYTRNET
jgi:uncharacterized protein (TIGR02147 family)